MENTYEKRGEDPCYEGISSLDKSYNKFMENYKKKAISEKKEKEDILSDIVEYCLNNNNVGALRGELSEDIYEKFCKLSSFITPSTEKFRVNHRADGYTIIRYKAVGIVIYKHRFSFLNLLEFD